MIKDFDITQTKLIIWDLDDTFWEGTLSEGGIKFKNEYLLLIKELATRGIMNSICSKNDLTDVKKEFIMGGYSLFWDFFVFPSINWAPKGQRVKDIITSMNLREENVIVIDDNDMNINEIKYYCPKIMSAHPDNINIIQKEIYLVNSYDFEFTRLKEYKHLEEKQKDKINTNCSNEDFLKNSEIKVCIKKDCMENLERIDTLIHRTNQLNFTKKRVDKENLKYYFKNPEQYESAYVLVQDKYGDYGIVGFYVLNKQETRLEHFLFSCRIMNMGVEQFLYSYLNKPQIDIIPPVSAELSYEADWIELVDELEKREVKQKPQTDNINILFKGSCDLYSTISYIAGNCTIDTEFPYWNKQLAYIVSHTHTAFIEQSDRLSKIELYNLSAKFPNPNPDEFTTEFFNPKYDVVVLSTLINSYLGAYINKFDKHYAIYGYSCCDITDENNWDEVLSSIPEEYKEQNKEILRQFKKEYDFAGAPPLKDTIKNLEYIKTHLKPETHLILILGSEIDTPKKIVGYDGMADRNRILNKGIREWAEKYPDIDLIEVSDLIESDDDYSNCINHFSRRIYAELAKNIISKVNTNLGKECLELKQ